MCTIRHDRVMRSVFGTHPASDLFVNVEKLTATGRRARYTVPILQIYTESYEVHMEQIN